MLKVILIDYINVKEPKTFMKDGKSWQAWPVGIVVKDQYGQDQWINGLVNSHPTWQKGDKVTLDIYENTWTDREGQQKKGWNFRLPNKDTENIERLKALELRVSVLEGRMDSLSTQPVKPLKSKDFAPSEAVALDSTSVTLDDGSEIQIPF